MSDFEFPDIESAQRWFATTIESLEVLRLAALKGKLLPQSAIAEILHMSETELNEFFRRKLMIHEMFATLALFAACESGLRRDFFWRATGNNGQKFHGKFQSLLRLNNGSHVGISRIFGAWFSALSGTHFAKKDLRKLRELFYERNKLAHGNAKIGAYAFEPIYAEFSRIRTSWKSEIHDFKKY